MAERATLDPTIDEIVVALRETTRGAGRAPPFTVGGGRQPERAWGADAAGRGGSGEAPSRGGVASGAMNWAGPTDIGELRDAEIERLLGENARQNERVVFLLKLLERDQARNAELAAERAARESDNGALLREIRAAIEAELRPVLLLVLRLLKTQRTDATTDCSRQAEAEPEDFASPATATFDWPEIPRREPAVARKREPAAAASAAAPTMRQHAGRMLDALRR